MKISEAFNLIMKKIGKNDEQFANSLGYSLTYFKSVKYRGLRVGDTFFKKMYKKYPSCKEEIDELKKLSLIRDKEMKQKKIERQKIGKQIKRFRESRGLTLKEFGSKINTSYIYLKKIESGICSLSNKKFQKIIQEFKINLQDLISAESPKEDVILIDDKMFNKLTLLRKTSGESYLNLAEKINMSSYIFRYPFMSKPPFNLRKDVFTDILKSFEINSIEEFINLDEKNLKNVENKKYLKENDITNGIIRLRDEYMLSNNKFAKKVGVDPSMISRLLKKERNISLKCFKKILKTFNISFEQFKIMNEK